MVRQQLRRALEAAVASSSCISLRRVDLNRTVALAFAARDVAQGSWLATHGPVASFPGNQSAGQLSSFSSGTLVKVNAPKGGGDNEGDRGQKEKNSGDDEGFKVNWEKAYKAAIAASVAVFAWTFLFHGRDEELEEKEETVLTNWSATHTAKIKSIEEPESHEELEALVKKAHESGKKLRPMGSALSPNGIAFQEEGMVAMGLMDKVLHIDRDKAQVTVQAGARVQSVADALKPEGLTLENFASIREQQIGGFTQVSAHGTGMRIPPVDMQVVGLKLVTPAEGTVTLRPSDGDRFHLAKVGLGALGVVSEVTLQCVPAHRLLERTFVASRSEVRKNHRAWLKANKHLRYMWIPYTDSVVVVQCNETKEESVPKQSGWLKKEEKVYTDEEKLQPMKDLYAHMSGAKAVDMAGMSMTQLRDALLALSPLTRNFVAKVNAAEAEFWRRNAGSRVGWNDEILGFDCGGQQWVLEVAFPAGTQRKPDMRDIEYMEALLALIERHNLPAPAPIEQRWTSRSTSLLSPAFSENPDDIFSWVGIIMYLPDDDPVQRAAITNKFQEYVSLCEKELMPKFRAYWHWAKLEPPAEEQERQRLRRYLKQKYSLERFNELRRKWDPRGILGNDLVDAVFGTPRA